MANYGENNDLVEIKVELAVALEQIKGLRVDVNHISAQLDKITELETNNRIKISALMIVGFISGGAGSLLLKLISQ